MSPNQKRAWGNIVIWGGFLVASITVLAANGTAYYWQEDSLKGTFHIIMGTAIIAFFIMMLVVWLTTSKLVKTTDERDNKIMNQVNAVSGPIAMTAVAAAVLALMLIYLEDKSSVISPHFLTYIVLVNIVVYWLAQAILTLIAYKRN